MSAYARDIKDSLTFFVFVATTALCLSFTFSVFVYRLGVLDDPQRFLIANLVVAACVAIPTATIASQHEFQLKRYQRQLESLASTDPLTGLMNRRSFRLAAEDETLRQRRSHSMAAVVLFDLDEFKRINDLHGHQTGDAVLKRIAEIAYSELRGPFDKLGRWAGGIRDPALQRQSRPGLAGLQPPARTPCADCHRGRWQTAVGHGQLWLRNADSRLLARPGAGGRGPGTLRVENLRPEPHHLCRAAPRRIGLGVRAGFAYPRTA